MTIRLLSTINGAPPQSIITLDGPTETAYVNQGSATFDLTGGTIYYADVAPLMVAPAPRKLGSVSLAANQKATVPLVEGMVLQISGAAGTVGTAQRYDSAGAAVGAAIALSVGAAAAIGPFVGNYTVAINCASGGITATVGDAGTTSAQASADGKSIRTSSALMWIGAALLTLVTLGDSILGADTATENYDPTIRDPLVATYTTRARGIITTLNAKLGRPFKVVYYGAITGNTTIQMAARRTGVLARNANILAENGGVNNVSQYVALYGGDLDACVAGVIADRVATWEEAISLGYQMIIAIDCIPVGPTGNGFTTAQKAALTRINAGLRLAARNYPIVRFQDCASALVDFNSATGLVKSNMLYDGDRHPSAQGALAIVNKILEDKVVAGLAIKRPMVSSQLDCVQNDAKSKNLLHTNIGMMLGTPITAGAATGVTTAGSATVSGISFSRNIGSGATVLPTIIDAPDGVGKAQRMHITGGVAGDQIRMLILPGSTVTELPKGTWAYFECMVDISNGVNCLGVTCDAGVQFTGGSPASPLASLGMAVSVSETGGGYVTERLTLVSEPVYFPLNATALSFNKADIYVSFGAGGGAADVDVYRGRWIKLDA